MDYHSTLLERKTIPQEQAKKYREMNYDKVKNKLPDAWCPLKFHPWDEQDYYKLKDIKL